MRRSMPQSARSSYATRRYRWRLSRVWRHDLSRQAGQGGALVEQGIADNTVLWFASDNGPEGVEDIRPGRTGGLRERKRSLYEGGIRIPAVIEWPARVKAGSSTDAPIVTSDILPTLLGWAGSELPPGRQFDGIDIDPIVLGKVREPRSSIGFESQDQLVWLGDRYKLIYGVRRWQSKFGQSKETDIEFELYDIVNYPGETTDLSTQHPEITKRMAQELWRWRASVAASIPGDERSAIHESFDE